VQLCVLWVLLAPSLALIGFIGGTQLNLRATSENKIATDQFLVVQTGVLTALAILVALGGAFLPEDSTGMKWALAGALFGAIAASGFILYTMITQQSSSSINFKDKPWIPGITNAAWIALLSLAICCILAKMISTKMVDHSLASQGQVLIAHDRLSLGMSQTDAIARWGDPIMRTDAGLAYRTQSGIVIICLQNPPGSIDSISETTKTEVSENAVNAHCK
jgi:hypothetical protein